MRLEPPGPEGEGVEFWIDEGATKWFELTRAAALVKAAGGLEWSRGQAARLLTGALRELHTGEPDADLRSLAHLATWRDH